MTDYRQPPDSEHYSPALYPSYRTSNELNATELRPLDRPRTTHSRESSLQESGSYEYDGYRYNNAPDAEAKGLVTGDVYQRYKRRYFGLTVLTLLNFTTGWGNAAPGVVSTTATEWFDISYAQLNGLSIASSLVFLVPAPFVIWIFNAKGPKLSIIVACILTVLGNWVAYAATRAQNFPGNVVGIIISSLAAPFIMSAPTRYSRQWFGDRSRTFATALQSLAYPLGAGFGALTGPYMVEPIGPMDYAGQALLIAIVFTVVSIPVPFIPKEPPTPPSAVAAAKRLRVRESLKSIVRNRPFYLQFFTFAVVAGSIDTLTATTNQGVAAYGYTQNEAGFALACLVFVGILTAFIVSPILDRTKKHVLGLKVLVILIAASCTVLPFVPQTRSVPALMLVFAITGASTLSLQPCVLETQASWTHPVSPEFSSFICWSGAKVLAATFTIVVGNALALDEPRNGQPKGSLFYGQLLIAIMCWLTVPCAWMLGIWKFKKPSLAQIEGNN
ncbi:hypothetical protein LTR37_011745 [Vermiconidia calcicola]|uniref:Uncharacterized protein n=1 Tax=Vermiconidia calcicola TaxID=1690605 RepID=A0ACC3N1A8_9PEZI|nr:hypothetical protein LTR37_011745 [Vermiconidia calcicola]